jgi:carbon storage regulator CsrA
LHMLVLNRKIGQQIILPELGITIDVVEIGRSRVQLGIAAPSGVSIRRREVRDRRQCAEKGPPRGNYSSQKRGTGAGTEEQSAGIGPTPADLDRRLIQRVIDRTGSRISHLSVETLDGKIVIRGFARSHHARQLALAAVQEVVGVLKPPQCSVEFEIDVGPIYWRSASNSLGLRKFLG